MDLTNPGHLQLVCSRLPLAVFRSGGLAPALTGGILQDRSLWMGCCRCRAESPPRPPGNHAKTTHRGMVISTASVQSLSSARDQRGEGKTELCIVDSSCI